MQFLRTLMLINLSISELKSDSSNSLPLIVTIGIFFDRALYKLLPSTIICPSVLIFSEIIASYLGRLWNNIPARNATFSLKYMVSAVILSIIILKFTFVYDIIYCIDFYTEEELLASISKKEGMVQYFLQQAQETDRMFKQGLINNLPDDAKQELLTAKRETETNLNVEKKVLNSLRNKLNSGDYSKSFSESSLGKRNTNR